jgi:hypothetical protein
MMPRPTSRDWGQRLDGIATERDRESAVVMPCRSVSIVIRGTSLAGIGEPAEVGVQDERGGGLDRSATPLYSVAEAARYLDVPASTFATWTHGYRRRPAGRREVVGGPVLTALPRSGVRAPIIPFIGLVEGLVLAAMRRSGVPLQRIRPALERLEEEFGLAHALASQRLYTDGAEVLFDYAESADDPTAARAARELVVVRNDQRVFNEVVAAYL